MKPTNIGRYGTHNLYLGPNRNAPAMRYAAAKAAIARVATLRSELDAAVAHSKATGHGDHANENRLIDAIRQATGRMPWEASHV
jgi:hypothetical protein